MLFNKEEENSQCFQGSADQADCIPTRYLPSVAGLIPVAALPNLRIIEVGGLFFLDIKETLCACLRHDA